MPRLPCIALNHAKLLTAALGISARRERVKALRVFEKAKKAAEKKRRAAEKARQLAQVPAMPLRPHASAPPRMETAAVFFLVLERAADLTTHPHPSVTLVQHGNLAELSFVFRFPRFATQLHRKRHLANFP